jgi:hypothetical protein
MNTSSQIRYPAYLIAIITIFGQGNTAHANFAVEQVQVPPAPVPMHPGYPVVQGFGKGVPLRMALRLIAPRFVHVTIAHDVDPDLPLSWRGGLPWPATLATALAPLGIHLVATTTTATITIKRSR